MTNPLMIQLYPRIFFIKRFFSSLFGDISSSARGSSSSSVFFSFFVLFFSLFSFLLFSQGFFFTSSFSSSYLSPHSYKYITNPRILAIPTSNPRPTFIPYLVLSPSYATALQLFIPLLPPSSPNSPHRYQVESECDYD